MELRETSNSMLISYTEAKLKLYIWYFHLPISSINGAIRNVTPTKSKHINNSRHAVAMIVHRARCDISSGSITCRSQKLNDRNWHVSHKQPDLYCTEIKCKIRSICG